MITRLIFISNVIISKGIWYPFYDISIILIKYFTILSKYKQAMEEHLSDNRHVV